MPIHARVRAGHRGGRAYNLDHQGLGKPVFLMTAASYDPITHRVRDEVTGRIGLLSAGVQYSLTLRPGDGSLCLTVLADS